MPFLRLQSFLFTFRRHPLEAVLSVAFLTPDLETFHCLTICIFLRGSGLGLTFATDDRYRVSDEEI